MRTVSQKFDYRTVLICNRETQADGEISHRCHGPDAICKISWLVSRKVLLTHSKKGFCCVIIRAIKIPTPSLQPSATKLLVSHCWLINLLY